MARSHGRILASIWSDPDFRGLPANAQQLYMLLLSQPNLTHAGTISITVRRWAGMTVDATTETVLAALRVLSDRRFIVVEWDTEELLVRTLIRNDQVFKQPKVLRAAKADAEAIASPKIRRALRAEVMACPLEAVTENARDEVSALLTALSESLDTPPDDPGGRVCDTPTDTPGQAVAIPEAKAPRSARGGSPTPTPAPTTRLPASPRDAGDDPARTLANRYYERLDGLTSWGGNYKIIKRFVQRGRDPSALADALDRLADADVSLTLESLRRELGGNTGTGPTGNLAAHLAVVRQLEQGESA